MTIHSIRAWFRPGLGIVTWLLACVMVFFVTANVAEARWVEAPVPLASAALMACVVGGIFARLRAVPALVLHVIALALGLAWTLRLLPLDPRLDSLWDRGSEMLIRGLEAVRTLKQGGTPEDFYLFILGGLLLAWLLGYTTLWLLLRLNGAWRAVLLNGGVLMLNLTYATTKGRPSFWLFLVTALLLIVFETFRARQRRWEASALEQQEWLSVRFLWSGLVACMLLVILSAMLPATITNAQLQALSARLSTPFDKVSDWLNLPGTGGSASPPATQPNRANFANTSVTLGGARVATNRIVLEVRASQPEYWRSNAWDFYNGRGWENTTGELAQSFLRTSTRRAALTPISAGTPIIQLDDADRTAVTQTITLRQARDDQQLPAATTPYSWTLPVLVQNTFIEEPGESPIPNFTDSTIFFNQGDTPEGLTYTVVSLVGDSDKLSLRQSSTQYPPWVQRYLQLPNNPEMRRIAALTRQVVAAQGADNPYDIASAIEAYLRTFPYDDQIPSPPENADPIANFLFELQRGYCDYFAGAMVLMLRSQGVPARWVQGYATGDYDPELGAYVVRDTIAHSWPEVYFVGYGWQRFEPTPAGYATVPTRPEFPPDMAQNPEDDIGPNGGIVNQPAPGPNFEALEELRENAANATPVPTPLPEALPPEEALAAVEERPLPLLVRWFLVLAALVALGLLIVWIMINRETRGLPPASRAYALMSQLAQWAGLPRRPNRTAREYAEDLGKQMPGHRPALRRLTDAYTHERYSRFGKVDPDAVRRDVAPINRRLSRSALRRSGRILLEQLGRQRARLRRRNADDEPRSE